MPACLCQPSERQIERRSAGESVVESRLCWNTCTSWLDSVPKRIWHWSGTKAPCWTEKTSTVSLCCHAHNAHTHTWAQTHTITQALPGCLFLPIQQPLYISLIRLGLVASAGFPCRQMFSAHPISSTGISVTAPFILLHLVGAQNRKLVLQSYCRRKKTAAPERVWYYACCTVD